MLNPAGKVLEELIKSRLAVSATGNIPLRQFGFRAWISMVDTVMGIVNVVRRVEVHSRRSPRRALFVAIDVNAFNSDMLMF